MDRINLPNGKTYDAAWAADVIGTNKWSALIPGVTIAQIAADFDGASPIIVENAKTGSHTYEGYTLLEAAYTRQDGVQIVLAKEV